MAGRFQETKGRWEIVSSPTTTVEKVYMKDGSTLADTLVALNAEFADNQEILELWRLSESSITPISP